MRYFCQYLPDSHLRGAGPGPGNEFGMGGPITGSGGIILTTATALDQNENVYAVGAFRDSIEVGTNSGPVKLVSKGNEDMFIAKIDPDGGLIWIKQVGGKGQMGLTGGADLSRNDWFRL